MSDPAPNATQSSPSEPPAPPGPGASREDWHAWRHSRRQWAHANGWGPWGYGWYGPWSGGHRHWFWPIVFIVIGVYLLLNNLGWLSWLTPGIFWSSLLILFGVFLLAGRWRRHH